MSIAGRRIRNAFRNATRTFSIVLILGLAIGLAFVMLTAHRAVSDKVATTLRSIGNTVTIGPPGYSAGGRLGRFLTSAELAPIARLHGVTGVNESLNGSVKASDLPPVSATDTGSNSPKAFNSGGSKVKVHNSPGSSLVKLGSTSLKYPGTLALATQGLACEPKPCTPPTSYFTIYLSGSTEPTAAVNIGASTLKIVSGHAISGTSSAYDAMISTEMARKNGLKLGSTFTAYGKILTVAAIFESDSQQGNDTVITSLPVLQRLMGGTDKVFTATVTVASLTDLSKVTSEIERVLGPRASVVSYLADADRAADDLNGVKGIALDSLGIIAANPVTSQLVSHTGVSSDTGARGLFGAGSPVLARLTDVNAQFRWTVILEGLAAAVLVAAFASAAAAWMISRIRPAEVLRSV